MGNWCSSPRKEKNSKPPTGGNIVPHKQIIRVNPNGGKKGGIPEKESPGIANPKGDMSWRQTELIPRCQRENSNEYPSWHQKELILRRQLRSPLGMKIPVDSFSGIPLCFRWRLRINYFWCQLGSSLEFSRWHLGINSVWRQLILPLGFAIPGDSFSGIPPFFPQLGFTLIICLWGTIFPPVGGLLFFSFLGGLHFFTVFGSVPPPNLIWLTFNGIISNSS